MREPGLPPASRVSVRKTLREFSQPRRRARRAAANRRRNNRTGPPPTDRLCTKFSRARRTAPNHSQRIKRTKLVNNGMVSSSSCCSSQRRREDREPPATRNASTAIQISTIRALISHPSYKKKETNSSKKITDRTGSLICFWLWLFSPPHPSSRSSRLLLAPQDPVKS